MPPWNNQDMPFAKTVIVVADKRAFSSPNNAISVLQNSQSIGLILRYPSSIRSTSNSFGYWHHKNEEMSALWHEGDVNHLLSYLVGVPGALLWFVRLQRHRTLLLFWGSAHVRSWHKAGMTAAFVNVRFQDKNGHRVDLPPVSRTRTQWQALTDPRQRNRRHVKTHRICGSVSELTAAQIAKE